MPPSLPDGHSGVQGNDGSLGCHRRTALTCAAVSAVADLLGVDATTVSTSSPFTDLGLSSTQLARLTAHLEDAMGVEVPLTAIYDHPDIEQLVEYLAMR
ncbi:acyl carrier protein [Nocardia sp. NBC_00508]|uniref:acyl carrier protein n=1 Tax=Nocardia sp. NBC_00508 TaxID=2975992 RepID=UPI002E81DFE6|nr:acyl carrier protein [Nocardia sp. NBC_00508]WUD69355.1 acyl carrier protein [Nocardia sp. NBC_00508]